MAHKAPKTFDHHLSVTNQRALALQATAIAVLTGAVIRVTTSTVTVNTFAGTIAQPALCNVTVTLILVQENLTASRTTVSQISHHLPKELIFINAGIL